MTVTEFVQVVTLAFSPPAPGTQCVTAGWGPLFGTMTYMSWWLQKLPASIVDREECITRYADCSDCPDIAEDAFCSGAGDAGPCFGYMWGDVGGPLVCGGKLAGVVSWGIGCGGYPWVNTDIVTHIQWIMETMGKQY